MDSTRLSSVLAVGDHVVIALVLGWGYVDHHPDGLAGLLDLTGLVSAAGPFLLAFLFVALVAGTYGRARLVDRWWSLRTVAATWFGAVGVGLVLRTSPLVGDGATWPFALVVTGTGLLALLAWRLAVDLALVRRLDVES